jgi:hypothetical protein
MSSTPFLNFANFPFVGFKMQILIYYCTCQASDKTYVLHHFKGPNNSYVLVHIEILKNQCLNNKEHMLQDCLQLVP